MEVSQVLRELLGKKKGNEKSKKDDRQKIPIQKNRPQNDYNVRQSFLAAVVFLLQQLLSIFETEKQQQQYQHFSAAAGGGVWKIETLLMTQKIVGCCFFFILFCFSPPRLSLSLPVINLMTSSGTQATDTDQQGTVIITDILPCKATPPPPLAVCTSSSSSSEVQLPFFHHFR